MEEDTPYSRDACVQRVVAQVLRFHHLFVGKSKWEIHVGSDLRDMRHLFMGLWCFLCNENFHYCPEGALEEWREPKYTVIDFVEAAKPMENWVGIAPCSRLFR